MFSNLSRFGPSLPSCNNRQFSTFGILKNHPEEMKLKPEYLSNENFKFVNNFGLSNAIISDKTFIDINNSVNCQRTGCSAGPNSGYILRSISATISPPKASYCNRYYDSVNEKSNITNIYEKIPNILLSNQSIAEARKTDMVASKQENIERCDVTDSTTKNCEASTRCDNLSIPKKIDGNKMPLQTSKSAKKSKKNFHKQSKRESDRNICSSMPPQKRKNKPWHKKSLKMEIMEIDDVFNCPYSDPNLESPIVQPEFNVDTVCIKNKINSIPYPTKCNSTKIEDSKLSPTIQVIDQNGHINDVEIDHSVKRNHFRPRLPSECESEDSFIIFDDGSNCVDMELSDCDDSDISSDEDASSSSSENDGDRNGDFCQPAKQAYCAIKTASPYKKVRFAADKDLCEVHPMIQWSFAYQKARKGPWEQFAVDRVRFKNRVSSIEPTLNVILQSAHRDHIYKERFLQDN